MLAIFLKYPIPGQVKTRIAQDTNQETASQIYKILAEEVVNQLTEFKPTLHYAGCTIEQIQQWLPKQNYQLQSDGDLGNRLINASQKHFQESNEKFIIIGTDCPEINSKTIEQTLQLLDHNDLVVGPTDDGGYYLIATKSHQPQLFKNIDWSTEKVYQQTLDNGGELGLTHKSLSMKCDIDYWHQVPEKYKNMIGI